MIHGRTAARDLVEGPLYRRAEANGRGSEFLALLLIVPALVLAFHWRAALPGRAFAGEDILHFFLGVRDATASALREGRIPRWNRGVFLGYPLIGDPQAAIFDPATWLTLPWEAARALTIATLFHLVIMGWGMACWMRRRGLGVAEALLAAVLFALGAKQTVHLQHWNFAATTAWWPWMVLGIESFVAEGRPRWIVLIAVATAACWFGGSPQMAYFGMLIAGARWLTLLPGAWGRSRRDAFVPAAALACGVLLAMPAIAPAVELAKFGPRGVADLGYGFTTAFKWRDRYDLALLLMPRAFGSMPWQGGTNLWEATGYVGIMGLALAAAANVRARNLGLFAVVAILGVWLSFGDNAWLGIHRAAYEALPGYRLFRVPTRALMLSAFSVAVLAAEGLAALRSGEPGSVRRTYAAIAMIAAIALLVPRLPNLPLDRDATRNASIMALALAAATAGWVALARWCRRGELFAATAALVCALEHYIAFGDHNPVVPARDLVPKLSSLSPLVQRVGGRVAIAGKLLVNEPQRLGWEGVTSYGPLSVDRARRLIEATRYGTLEDRPGIDPLEPRGNPASPLWPLLATPLVSEVQLVADETPAAVLGASGIALRVMRAAALPRIFWVGAFTVDDRGNDAVLRALVRAASGDIVVLAETPSLTSGEPAGPVPAEEVSIGESTTSARVVAPRDGIVVILDPWFPGWEATVDGHPAQLHRANYAFQGVVVSSGVHRIEVKYRSRGLRWGLALAFAAGLGVAGLGWYIGRRPRAC